MYTIRQIADKTNLTEHTIRYYDREGLIPFLARSKSGSRQFSEDDLEWIQLVCCLRNSGMPLQEIKEFMQMCLKGKESFEERKRLLIQHKEKILNDMKNLEKSLTTIQYKIDHYKELGIFHIDRE
ncbi:MAG: MerR family transcriptional regulator [Lachnospiraceae bacterium]|nr:MerR family transcriptional regulator [Lachnospiraceae bacterium]MDD3659473.1 MerR family transcriptional regulator [Lachnospiraceae bacterium]